MNEKSPTEGRLRDKIAIVTGGAAGIGEGICLEFAAQGADVAIADVNGQGAESVAKKIHELGRRAIVLEVDVRDSAKVKEMTAKVLGHFGTIDILVNCAGFNQFKLPHEFFPEEWEKLRSVILDGAWYFCQAVIPEMIRKQRGKIVNIGSGSSILATPKAAPYVIAKHGLAGLTKALAVDLGGYNVNVNCICPGSVDTPLLRTATSPAYREAITNRIPLGRIGRVCDIAKAALFLVSSDSDWITGVVLPVDGGLTCCSFAHHYE